MGQISVQGLTDAETGSGKKWISWSYLARVWLKELHEKTVGILLGGGGEGRDSFWETLICSFVFSSLS